MIPPLISDFPLFPGLENFALDGAGLGVVPVAPEVGQPSWLDFPEILFSVSLIVKQLNTQATITHRDDGGVLVKQKSKLTSFPVPRYVCADWRDRRAMQRRRFLFAM